MYVYIYCNYIKITFKRINIEYYAATNKVGLINKEVWRNIKILKVERYIHNICLCIYIL